MGIDIISLFRDGLAESYNLYERYINFQYRRYLTLAGFEKKYCKAQGQYLYDGDGNRYTDFLSGYNVFNFGHNNQFLHSIVIDILKNNLPNLIQLDCPPLAGRLAEAIVSILPTPLDTVLFANTGSEVVEGAIKYARAYTGRKKILYLKNSFHGMTCGTLSVMDNRVWRKDFEPLLPFCEGININNLDEAREKLLKREYACIIIEVIQSEGGVVACRKDYLEKLYLLCKDTGTLLIVDEIQTGLLRCGKNFAFEYYDIIPDILLIAKSLGGGIVPVSAMAYSKKIARKIYRSLYHCQMHTSTYTENTLAMAIGLGVMEMLKDKNIIENQRAISFYLFDRLHMLKEKYDLIEDVRGKGLFIGLKLAPQRLRIYKNITDKVSEGFISHLVTMHMLKKYRILMFCASNDMSVLKIMPPLIINRRDAEYFIDSLDRTMEKIHSPVGCLIDTCMDLIKNFTMLKRIN